MKKVASKPTPTRLVTRAQLRESIGVSDSHLKTVIFPQMTKGVHYFQMNPEGRKYLYHEALILDLIVNGSDSEAHRRACDAFVRSLASSQAA